MIIPVAKYFVFSHWFDSALIIQEWLHWFSQAVSSLAQFIYVFRLQDTVTVVMCGLLHY